MFEVRLLFRGKHRCLGRAVVRVLIAGLRNSGGTATRFEVVQIKHSFLNDGTDWISHVIGSPNIIAFFGEKDVIPPRSDASGLIRFKYFRETPARDRGHAGLTLLNASDIEECGSEINEAHVVIHHPTRLGDTLRPHNGQRQVVGVVVGIAFAVRKRHAVVGGHDHDRVLEFTPLLQLGEHSP